MKRILVYSHDTYGLGNIRRMMAVVEGLTARNPETSALVLSGSPMLQAFRLGPRIDYIKLPCLLRGEDGQYSSKYLDLPYDKLLNLRADLILNTMLDLEPDLVLVDKKPLGVQNELAPALQVLRRRHTRPKLALILREILDAPQLTQDIWTKNKYHEAIAELYDKVLVLGSREIFDTAAEYAFPQTTVERLHYCGYLSKQATIRPREQVRAELGLQNALLVLVTPGGGQDGFNLINTICQAFPSPSSSIGVHFLICVGPEMAESQRMILHRKIDGQAHMTALDFTNDMMSYMNAANLVVSMAGYNTVTELMTLKKRAILVPRTQPAQEQWIRATRLERHGRFTTIHPDQLSADVLRQAVARALTAARSSRELLHVNMNALDEIAAQLEGLFAADETGGWERLLLDSAPVPPEKLRDQGHDNVRSFFSALGKA